MSTKYYTQLSSLLKLRTYPKICSKESLLLRNEKYRNVRSRNTTLLFTTGTFLHFVKYWSDSKYIQQIIGTYYCLYAVIKQFEFADLAHYFQNYFFAILIIVLILAKLLFH